MIGQLGKPDTARWQQGVDHGREQQHALLGGSLDAQAGRLQDLTVAHHLVGDGAGLATLAQLGEMVGSGCLPPAASPRISQGSTTRWLTVQINDFGNLLRVLQEGQFERVGEERFREDLYSASVCSPSIRLTTTAQVMPKGSTYQALMGMCLKLA